MHVVPLSSWISWTMKDHYGDGHPPATKHQIQPRPIYLPEPGKLHYWLCDSLLDPECCLGNVHPINGRSYYHVVVDGHTQEVVDSFCYMEDTISTGGRCKLATISRVKAAWAKSRELLPLLTYRALSLATRGMEFIIAAAEARRCTEVTDLSWLQRNECSMLQWM